MADSNWDRAPSMALDRLSDQGLIKSTRTEVVDGRLRRYYAITGTGLEAVRNEAANRAAVLDAAAARLNPRRRTSLALPRSNGRFGS